MWAKQKQTTSRQSHDGFTIVELLIVIVVIALLAAIVITAYTGVQNKAHAAAAQSASSTVSKLLMNSYTMNGAYPADLSTISNGNPLPNTDGSTYAYHPGVGNTSYCVTVTNGNSSYKVTDTATQPTAGGCPGDGVNGAAAITNVVINPSLESGSTSNLGTYYAGPITIDATTGAYGTASALVTTNSATNPQGMMWYTSPATAGTAYVCSVSFKGTPGQTIAVAGRFNSASGYLSEGAGSTDVTLSNSWQRVTISFTTPPTTTAMFLQYHLKVAASGVQIWGDGAMCTQGSSTYNYADGSSPNWIWNGTPNTSTSTGSPQ